jgi:hypothetical protein
MSAIGLLFFAGCSALIATVLAAMGLVLRSHAESRLARWYARALLLVAVAAVVVALWLAWRALG